MVSHYGASIGRCADGQQNTEVSKASKGLIGREKFENGPVGSLVGRREKMLSASATKGRCVFALNMITVHGTTIRI